MKCSSCGLHHKDESNCIERVPIFSHLTYDEMLEVASITRAKTFDKNEMIYMSGDEGGKLFVLHTGKVKVSRINTSGKEQVIRVVGPGEFMGELSLLSNQRLTDNAQALESSTMCIIEGNKLKELMGKYPTIALKVMEELSKRLEKAENLIENINLNSVEQRLAQSLLSLANGGKVVNLNMTKGEFASQIGMSQETLSRKLTAFQDQGLIELEGQRKIKILDKQGLEDIID
jgi:CRP/FNR family transcriptional regulator